MPICQGTIHVPTTQQPGRSLGDHRRLDQAWCRASRAGCVEAAMPLHYLLVPPCCFHLLCFLLNSLPRLKVSISGLGPKVKFFGNFQLSSFSHW